MATVFRPSFTKPLPLVNPFVGTPKTDESADVRRKRRALTEDQLARLLRVAELRPLAEYGRPVCRTKGADQRSNKRSRATWTRAPLSLDSLEMAVASARNALTDNPELIAKLERRGRERAHVYRTLVLTGLRRGELAQLC